MLRKLCLVLFLLSSTQVDPNLFGIRDQFHKKHFFFTDLCVGEMVSGLIQVDYIYCVLCFYYYCIVIYKEIIIQLTIM